MVVPCGTSVARTRGRNDGRLWMARHAEEVTADEVCWYGEYVACKNVRAHLRVGDETVIHLGDGFRTVYVPSLRHCV